jgi:hypothetical protein
VTAVFRIHAPHRERWVRSAVWYALGAAANDTLFARYLDGEPFDPRDVYILRQAR